MHASFLAIIMVDNQATFFDMPYKDPQPLTIIDLPIGFFVLQQGNALSIWVPGQLAEGN